MESTGTDTSELGRPQGSAPYDFLSELPRQGRGGTTQRVQDVIREAIVALAFAPGQFIHKDAICKRLGVSRFPVSEALGRLADEGFVEILPQRGTRVTHVDMPSCRQAMFIRRALEGEAMRVIAPRAAGRVMPRIEQNLAEQKLAVDRGDGIAFFRHDIAFHDMLLSELAFDRVRSVVDAARGSLDRTRLFLLRTPQRQHQSYVEHVAIAGALKAGDPDAAQRAMAEHLDRVLDEIELRAAQNPQAFAPSARS
ncbi:MAG TPA: GntR family transcriptional regulator [Xanthobacteraceae bacterium]|nr:GntR family transcriptional regulator [Xanthobacteraceae bacterium]